MLAAFQYVSEIYEAWIDVLFIYLRDELFNQLIFSVFRITYFALVLWRLTVVIN